ncbi:MAG: hypothetical protein SGILL_000987, partial [Bacillariaceae sp.]
MPEEAARTGKKYEEVLAEQKMKKRAAAIADEQTRDAAIVSSEQRPRSPSPPQDLPGIDAPTALATASSANTTHFAGIRQLQATSASASIPTSADAMLQLEARRRNLAEREERLLQMRMEMQAELQARNAPMRPAGFATGSLYNARGMNPMMGLGSVSQQFGPTVQMNSSLLAQQRAAMASNLQASPFHLQAAASAGMGMGMGAG